MEGTSEGQLVSTTGLDMRPSLKRWASNPSPSHEREAPDEGQRPDPDPDSATGHEALGSELGIEPLQRPNGSHRSEGDTCDDSGDTHRRIVYPRIDRPADIGTKHQPQLLVDRYLAVRHTCRPGGSESVLTCRLAEPRRRRPGRRCRSRDLAGVVPRRRDAGVGFRCGGRGVGHHIRRPPSRRYDTRTVSGNDGCPRREVLGWGDPRRLRPLRLRDDSASRRSTHSEGPATTIPPRRS